MDSQLPKCSIGIISHKIVRKLSKNRLQLGSLRCSSRLTSRINPNSYSTSLTAAPRPVWAVCSLPRNCWLHHLSGMSDASANNSKQWHRQGRDLWTNTLKRIKSVHRGRAPNPCMSIGNGLAQGIFQDLEHGVSTNPWGSPPFPSSFPPLSLPSLPLPSLPIPLS